MDNQRGNTWSKEHLTFDPCSNCSEFWHYSWDDSAVHDYTVGIDYVLEQTGFADLFFVGYSMGTTRYFAMLSERPEYNNKIKAGFLMGPASSMTNADSPIFDFAEQAEDLQELLHHLGKDEFFFNKLAPSYEFQVTMSSFPAVS